MWETASNDIIRCRKRLKETDEEDRVARKSYAQSPSVEGITRASVTPRFVSVRKYRI
jgi:hypothetical protein